MPIRILITVHLIRTTDITGHIHIMDMLGRHFIGPTDTAFIIGITDITVTGINRDKRISKPVGGNARRFYFFGEPEPAGAAEDGLCDAGSVNSFFSRS